MSARVLLSINILVTWFHADDSAMKAQEYESHKHRSPCWSLAWLIYTTPQTYHISINFKASTPSGSKYRFNTRTSRAGERETHDAQSLLMHTATRTSSPPRSRPLARFIVTRGYHATNKSSIIWWRDLLMLFLASLAASFPRETFYF